MFVLPKSLQAHVERLIQEQLRDEHGQLFDFSQPPGEPALTDANSISWKVFSNPLSLMIGGITAVLLELAEPKVRSGVWDHTTFRTNPLRRMRRTGLAAMITVYAAKDQALAMIARVRKMHDQVKGYTPEGDPYHANDPELLAWVHATASFGFLEAYHKYLNPLSLEERDQFYREGIPIAKLYGAENPPASSAELEAFFKYMSPRLQPSKILNEFVQIMDSLPLLPRPLQWMHPILVTEAISLLPEPLQDKLDLQHRKSTRWSAPLLRKIARLTETFPLQSSPYHQAKSRVKS